MADLTSCTILVFSVNKNKSKLCCYMICYMIGLLTLYILSVKITGWINCFTKYKAKISPFTISDCLYMPLQKNNVSTYYYFKNLFLC